MDAGAILRLIAAGRTLLGLVALVRPEVPARPWVGSAVAGTPGGRVMSRALGARDLVLGLGGLVSPSPRGWAAAGALADGLDAAVTLGAFAKLPRRGRGWVLASTAGAAVAGGLALGSRNRHP